MDAIIASDWHTSPRAWVRRPDVFGDSYCSFNQIIDKAIEHQADILAPGDLADVNTPDSRTVDVLRRGHSKLSLYNLRTLFVEGQHEMSVPPWLSVIAPDNAFSLHNEEYRLKSGLTVRGLNYQTGDKVAEALSQLPAADILITHQVFADFSGHGPAKLSSIPAGRFKLIVTGDNHRALMWTDYCGHPRIMSPGSTCMQATDESADKYIYLLRADLSIEPIKLKTRPFMKLKLSGAESLHKMLATSIDDLFGDISGLPPEISRPFLVIEYDDDLPDAFSRLQDRFKDCVLELLPVPAAQEAPALPRPEAQSGDFNSALQKCAVQQFGTELDPEDHILATALWTSTDPKKVINELFPTIK